ncbi:MAG: hypothetical protein HYX47_12060 [Burkholderiales bacterium]|nr:hypothetical protein [Burkholderiales bacterium]
MKTSKSALGCVLGRIQVPAGLQEVAEGAARAFWAHQVATDFSEPVDTARAPRGTGGLGWVPAAELGSLGFRSSTENHWVMTADADPHVDRAWGTTLLWVLVNPALRFKQRGSSPIQPAQGDWLIFDDFAEHSVSPSRSTPDDGVFLAWAVRVFEKRTTARQ